MNEEKRSFKEHISLIWRGYKFLFKVHPANMIWRTINCISQQLTPFFTLYMSSLVINELIAGASIKRLLTLALITISGQLFMTTIINFINWMAYKTESIQWYKEDMYYLNHQNKMQYEHLENPDVTLLRQKIANAKDTFAGGLMRLYWCYWFFLSSLVNIICSVSLTVSMFKMSAKGDFESFFAFVNSPVSVLVVLILIFINVAVSVVSSNRETDKTAKIWENRTTENTKLEAFQRCWGADVIVFDMRKIILAEQKRLEDPGFIRKIEKLQLKFGSLRTVWTALMNIALFIFVGAKAYIGVFGIGSFVLYRGTVEKFIEAASTIGTRVGQLAQNNKYLAQLFEYLDLPNNMASGSLPVEKKENGSYEIEFKNVSFKYPRSKEYSLKNVSMKFKAGHKLAIVGMNGSGKTTFIKLLCRLYDPTEGVILLNGVDIKEYKYEDYLSVFSVVFQDFSLFSFSIARNVACRADYDPEKVKSCLEKAGFGDRLMTLEKGIETSLYRDYENDGIDISGGESQKIAIARALYKDAPFILLDEPTAALDPVAEFEIYSKFNEIVGNKTAVFISHRLSSCRFCDDIIVFDEGRILQRGCHDQLVADQSGKYYELWQAQAKYYAHEPECETV